ncbi:putative colanic acid biosynthesis acetyltransferase [Erythrobacter aquimaris]|uniref:Putative colanic acid biosynthesis acetyltransferase n=1 Tax=Qipengyuania aquimaris TaxID=255984 RepID=A0A6I4TMI1_9SPHN|nr:putative colanic acid biosynthesis acetyltransferase [Qipengyuania aquimaris]MXO96489.1 putative colanic acid biosynthesis acetyltransferase [Qipengyuania aquimaris]
MEPLDARTARSRDGGPSFPLGSRVLRALWSLCWLLLARWTPPPLHGWRAFLLKCFGARLGPNCRVHASARIWWPGNLQCGSSVLIGPEAIIYNQGRITIGDGAIISQRAHLCAGTHDIEDPHFQLVLAPIEIGSSCWIAAEAFVGPRVSMAEGSVLAARAVLFTDAEPWTVYSGNPATAFKTRAPQAGATSGR